MSLGDALRELGGFLDACRADGTVASIELTGADGAADERAMTAEVVLSAVPGPGDGESAGLAVTDARVGDDGTLALGFESVEPVVPAGAHDVTVESTDATLAGDGTVTVRLVVSARVGGAVSAAAAPSREGKPVSGANTESESESEPVAAGADSGSGSGSGALAARDRDVPPFRDRELLAEVYESCDTFAEMTDAIGMDVTPETVRRYMVDHGIHQPNTYDTGRAEEAERGESSTDATGEAPVDGGVTAEEEPEPEPEPAVIADGIGLPDDVTVERLIETVRRSNTIYEVRQDIGIEHDDALEILKELNLLDLVVGRLATEAERDISRDEIVRRLREASATQ